MTLQQRLDLETYTIWTWQLSLFRIEFQFFVMKFCFNLLETIRNFAQKRFQGVVGEKFIRLITSNQTKIFELDGNNLNSSFFYFFATLTKSTREQPSSFISKFPSTSQQMQNSPKKTFLHLDQFMHVLLCFALNSLIV